MKRGVSACPALSFFALSSHQLAAARDLGREIEGNNSMYVPRDCRWKLPWLAGRTHC